MKIKIFIFLFIISLKSFAGFYIDPLIGINLPSASVGNTNDYNGIGYGTKIGWKELGLSYGLDYQRINLESGDSVRDYWSTETGVFVGFDFPFLVRVWGTYLLNLTAKNDAGADYETGSGTKIGIGYTGIPLFSINAEFKSYNFDEDSTGSTVDDNYKSVFLSISFPFTL